MKKFKIIVSDNQEFVKTQNILFNKGYFWSNSNTYKYIMAWSRFPIIVQNFNDDNPIKNRIYYYDYVKEIEEYNTVKVYTAEIFIRKEKLKKINGKV